MTVIVREMKRGFLEEAMRNCKEEDNNGLLGAWTRPLGRPELSDNSV